MELYDRYKKNMLGVISDVGFVLHRNDHNQQREGADIQRDTAHQKVAVSCCSTHSGNEDYRMSS